MDRPYLTTTVMLVSVIGLSISLYTVLSSAFEEQQQPEGGEE